MRRREFIQLLGGAMIAVPRLAAAQGVSEVHRIGLLTPGPPAGPDAGSQGAPLFRALEQRGYVLNRNLLFDSKGAAGRVEQLPHLVDELVANRVEVIITFSFPAALAAKQHATIPVVVVAAGDPVATGLVDSLARPGGHVTGITEIATDLSAKRLELLKETVPTIKRVAVLWNADDLGMTLRYRATETAGRTIGVAITPLGVRAPDDFDGAFSAMTRDPPDAILMVTDVLTRLNRKRVYEFAVAHRLPAIYEEDSFARDGGLMSYGPDRDEVLARAAGLVDRILKGAKPAQLPLEEPTRFRFLINLKTADALGLTVPASILGRADEVIE
ncbi:MAG TPA: ABC transporter substrate-binding protein [Stellaceae bacterium]|jgi:putative ABC transport system substrate-binding protein